MTFRLWDAGQTIRPFCTSSMVKVPLQKNFMLYDKAHPSLTRADRAPELHMYVSTCICVKLLLLIDWKTNHSLQMLPFPVTYCMYLLFSTFLHGTRNKWWSNGLFLVLTCGTRGPFLGWACRWPMDCMDMHHIFGAHKSEGHIFFCSSTWRHQCMKCGLQYNLQYCCTCWPSPVDDRCRLDV